MCIFAVANKKDWRCNNYAMVKILKQIILGLWGILPGNYSGITHVRDNVYAVVDDKDAIDGFKYLMLDIDSVSGKIKKAAMTEPEDMKRRRAEGANMYRDCEGVAFFGEGGTIFVSGEEDQRIMEYSLEGMPTGRELDIPASMRRDRIVGNLGFEALTYNASQRRFWTTTESTLPADGEQASARKREVRNRLRFVSFDHSLKACASYVYEMDLPKAKNTKATSIHGVPSLIALDDGRLIVMEREGCFPKKEYGSWVRIKLYMVNPEAEQRLSLDTPMDKVDSGRCMKKELVCSFTTHLRLGQMNLSNYEGMCLGPHLKDGRQTLILIADSQNGLGNWLYRIKDHVRVIILPC